VRGLLERVSLSDLLLWAIYFRIRNAPADRYVRDPDQIEAMTAMYYGG
jgi:hypothetical protein